MEKNDPKFSIIDGEKNILTTIKNTETFKKFDKQEIEKLAESEFNSVIKNFKKMKMEEEIKEKEKDEEEELKIFNSFENNNLFRKNQSIINSALIKCAEEKGCGNNNFNYPNINMYDIDFLEEYLREPYEYEEYCANVGEIKIDNGIKSINVEKNKCILFLLSKGKEYCVSGGCKFNPDNEKNNKYNGLCVGCLLWETNIAYWKNRINENSEEIILPFAVSAKGFDANQGLPQSNDFYGLTGLFPRIQNNTFVYVKEKKKCPVSLTYVQGYKFCFNENFSY